jgi:hypothetical protein
VTSLSMQTTPRSRTGWLVVKALLGAILVALVGYKAVRVVLSRLPDPPEKRLAAAPLAARKPVGALHFIAGHPRILLTGARTERLKAALAGPAGGRFKAIVDEQLRGEKQYGFRGYYAGFLYRLTGDAKYGKYAVSFIDGAVAAEEQKIAKGQSPDAADDSYLHVGELIGDVALTYDWCFDRLSESQKKRWLAYADQAVWNIWNPEKATWGSKREAWSGWATDNPNNNYFSAFLEATMLVGLAARGEHPRADHWVKEFREKHIGDELAPTYDRDLVGGGSREGTGYGTEMRRLFRLYDLWESATGERIADLTPHTKDSMLWAIHATVPTLDRIATIGDQARESSGALFDWNRDYVQMLTYLYRRDPLAGIGQWYLAHSSVPEMTQTYSIFYDVVYHQTDVAERPIQALYPVYYASGVGHLFARSSWQPDATWLNFLAGPFTESHAHADLGSFVIFKNEWLAYDAVIDSSSGLRREEAVHNLVELTKNGKPVQMQRERTARLTALEDNAAFLYAAADVTPVYADGAGVSSVQRELVFVKPDTFVVFDRVSARPPIAKTWHLNTPHKPVEKNNFVSIQGKKDNLTMTVLLPRGAKPKVVAWPRLESDMTAGYRIDVAGGTEQAVQFLAVLSLDGAVTRASEAADATGPTAELTLKDGRTVRVHFQSAVWGGEIAINGGKAPVKQLLKPAVARLPVFAR